MSHAGAIGLHASPDGGVEFLKRENAPVFHVGNSLTDRRQIVLPLHRPERGVVHEKIKRGALPPGVCGKAGEIIGIDPLF
ncbi:MAG TPA: hypothetical protein VIK18_21310 [Pirellulales bacterium]